MWIDQTTWQLIEEPSIEPFVRNAALLLVVAVSMFVTLKSFLSLGITSSKTNILLREIRVALQESDLAGISGMVKQLPRNCPEMGLTGLVGVAEAGNLGGVAQVLKQADIVFQSKLCKLSLLLEVMHTMVFLTLVGMCFWTIINVRALLIGLSIGKHVDASVVARVLGDLIPGIAEFLGVLTLVDLLKRTIGFRIRSRRLQWELFRTD